MCGPFFETILAYMPTQYFRNLGIHWLLPPVLALAWLVYAPGLSGGFLFDDFANLNALGNYAPIQDLDTLLRFLTSGTADPIGRPLSLASFLLNASDWPNNPGRFLQFNLLLHLANGALLFALLRRLGGVLGDSAQLGDRAALLATSLWLLHPLFVSTTLYAVQREAMLPATFVLSGLLAYTSGRRQFLRTDGRSGLTLMVCGITFGTLLGLLSKANGLLLPLLALTLEMTVFTRLLDSSLSAGAKTRLLRTKWVLLLLPSAALLA